MHKNANVELWQLKMSLVGLISQLNSGVDHLDTLTCKTIARALGEIMQEIISLANDTPREKLEQFARDVLVTTDEMHQELATKWFEQLEPVMIRANERAEFLDHELAEFSCVSVDGQEWGAICIKCLAWAFVHPEHVRGDALFLKCSGWIVSWK